MMGNRYRKSIWILVLILPGQLVFAQSAPALSLEQAWALANENYPLIRQNGLLDQTADLSIANLQKGMLPQIVLNGQGTYQSAVTHVSLPLPGISVPSPAKDQYKATADLSQLLYDGGTISSQKELQRRNADVEKEKIAVELYKVKDRVNQLYLGILLFDAQLKQMDLVMQDLQTGIDKTQALVTNGLTFRSNLDVLKAQLLVSGQRKIEIRSSRKGLIDALAVFTGRPLNEQTVFTTPAADQPVPAVIKRPELSLFSRQTDYLEQQKRSLLAKNLPKASVFGQGGYGKPGLNLFDDHFDWYYLAGVRVSWSLSGLYTYKKEKQLIDIGERSLDIQQQTFLLNTNAQLAQQQAEIDKLTQLLAADSEIIALRTRIKQAANAQLENAVITANDYLREVNAEDQARQSLILHQVQLLQARINYKTTAGSF